MPRGEGGILRSALKHTLQVTLFIFLITLALNGLLAVVGEDVLAEFLGANPALSVFGSALVGLVPNCAASIVIAQLYVEGVLGLGACWPVCSCRRAWACWCWFARTAI